jgi:hypothetical protein
MSGNGGMDSEDGDGYSPVGSNSKGLSQDYPVNAGKGCDNQFKAETDHRSILHHIRSIQPDCQQLSPATQWHRGIAVLVHVQVHARRPREDIEFSSRRRRGCFRKQQKQEKVGTYHNLPDLSPSFITISGCCSLIY